jgi:hypothetical protein
MLIEKDLDGGTVFLKYLFLREAIMMNRENIVDEQ